MFLESVLKRAAEAEHTDLTVFVDTLLRQAWTTPEAHEPELRLLDRVGHAYGIAGPRLLRELDDQATRIPDLAAQLRTQHAAWQAALDSASRANVDRFLERHPAWKPRLDEQALRALPPDDTRALTTELLDALGAATRADAAVSRRLAVLRDRATESEGVAYRMDVRAGVLLRLRARLIAVAGQEYLAQRGSAAERSAYESLRRCENLAIPPVPLPEDLRLARAEPFPPLDDDLAVTARVTPAWMGIQFRQPGESARREEHVGPGAAAVVAVYDDSPAKAAGLHPGDIVLGPPGRHFAERDQIREWTMLSPIDRAALLDVQRDGRPVPITLTPKPFPHKWPELPGPPKVGSAAPPLRLGSYRGTLPRSLASGTPHLLFFWATWCTICKSALPEVDAFERERHTPVVAITDEDRARLDPFFADHRGPFPALVATDENRQAFVAYGVSGMPTFVLVDGKGVVRGYATGYSPAKGLALDGWRWAGRPPASPPG
jgi:thiol-disulfide isomerase/thioredoxin